MAVGRIETILVFSAALGAAAIAVTALISPISGRHSDASKENIPSLAPAPIIAAIPVLAIAPPEVKFLPPDPPYVATVDNEGEWSPDRVPVQWPKFTVVAGQKPPPPRTAQQKLTMAKSVNARWQAYEDKKSPSFPTSAESGAAINYILTIDPASKEYPEAWATFIRLRQVDRLISSEAALENGRKMLRAKAKDRGVIIGMTSEEIRSSSWGRPRSINETLTANGRHEQWVYGGGYLYLENGRLTSIQTSRR